MNRKEKDILNQLCTTQYVNQREVAELTGYSLGIVNRSIRELIKEGYLNEQNQLTDKANAFIQKNAPQNAVILAAGIGMRMAPINMEVPKGLVEIYGETLIERIIRQLHEVGIYEIYIVVGFMKERFEYLIDEYGVELIVNEEYAVKNNLFSINLAACHLGNTYIIPCDIWCKYNPFQEHELYSWYMVSDQKDDDSEVRVTRKLELIATSGKYCGNVMIGISYLTREDAKTVRKKLAFLTRDRHNDNEFWEKTLYENGKMIVAARVVHPGDVVEINTYEQLRELDDQSGCLKTDAIKVIRRELKAASKEITEISVLKKGMTNHSFLFQCKGKKYIMRIPGEGTDRLIDRRQEACVYEKIAGKDICDNIIYMNPENGYKITEFWENARVCDPYNEDDVKKSMTCLREFHEMKISTDQEFDIFAQLEFYESLWEGEPSIYRDYEQTKENVFSLKTYIDTHAEEKVLTHIDAVPDNFLFIEEDGKEDIRLIDWEYAGMQDPHVDIAMFGIYSLYDRVQMDRLIDDYFEEGCSSAVRIKIYCYIAACGLLWSNWCEYKRILGVEFGEYSLKQYRYAKEYYRIVEKELENGRKDGDTK